MTRHRIDLRSDIHTTPTPEMRLAMARAEVGGDALTGEDCTTRELEEACADLFKRESALFACSGTMGNLVSLLAISHPGYSLIADPYTHIVSSEMEGFRQIARCMPVLVESDGVLTGDMVRACLAANALADGSAVICVENTHSLRGGKAWGKAVAAGLAGAAPAQFEAAHRWGEGFQCRGSHGRDCGGSDGGRGYRADLPVERFRGSNGVHHCRQEGND